MKTDYLKRYREYLKSLHWAQLKIQSAKAWGDGCYVCGSVPVDFHHLAYRNLVDCTPDDVIPLCRGCHSGAHFKGGMFRRIKALRDNDEKRRLLCEQLTRGLAEWRNRCTEAVSDWGGYLMRTGKKAEIERSKAAELAAKIKRHGEWAVLTPEGQLAQSRKKLERAIRLGMARDIIRKRQGKVRHLEALVAAQKQNKPPMKTLSARCWIPTCERRWTEAEREAGVWVWEGDCPLWAHMPDEQPRRLPTKAEWAAIPAGHGSAKDWSGAYASHWMPAIAGEAPPPLPRRCA